VEGKSHSYYHLGRGEDSLMFGHLDDAQEEEAGKVEPEADSADA